MYEICNLVNLSIDTVSNSDVNLGNVRNVGSLFTTKNQGGSESIGDFSNSFSADNNYIIGCDVQDTKKGATTTSSKPRQVKQKVINIVHGKKTKSYTSKKEQPKKGT